MKHMITEECCGCMSCAPFCENRCISCVDGKYVINQELCDGCGTCLEYCPIDNAIVPVLSA